MTRQRTIAACDKSAAEQFAPWSLQAEDKAITAWRALDRFLALEASDLRQERRAILEMQDMIARALDAIKGEA